MPRVALLLAAAVCYVLGVCSAGAHGAGTGTIAGRRRRLHAVPSLTAGRKPEESIWP